MGIGQDPREAAFEADFAALRAHYLNGLPAQRAAVAEAWRACADGGDAAPWLRLRATVHKLAGSAPNYGFTAVGMTARDVDKLLSGHNPCRERSRMRAPVECLLQELNAVAGET